MELRDVRRFAVSVVVLEALVAVWLFFLWLHDAGLFEWPWPRAALRAVTLSGWLGIGLAITLVLAVVVALVAFAIQQAPPGFAQGSLRQVQCQNCKAVFRVHDAGHRPITHVCPSCRHLGVYDGNAPPVGNPPVPVPPEKLVQLGLTCRNCDHRFKVIDTGVRPLRIACPECKSTGRIEDPAPAAPPGELAGEGGSAA